MLIQVFKKETPSNSPGVAELRLTPENSAERHQLYAIQDLLREVGAELYNFENESTGEDGISLALRCQLQLGINMDDIIYLLNKDRALTFDFRVDPGSCKQF